MSTKLFRLTLLAGAIGLGFAAAPVAAQDYGRTDDAYTAPQTIAVADRTADDEEVIVVAPRYRPDRDRVSPLGLPGKLSLSRPVSYHDLDLRSYEGAQELRDRVSNMAHEVCNELADVYRVRQQPGATKCFEGAYQDGMVKANAAIRDARFDRYYQAGYRRY